MRGRARAREDPPSGEREDPPNAPSAKILGRSTRKTRREGDPPRWREARVRTRFRLTSFTPPPPSPGPPADASPSGRVHRLGAGGASPPGANRRRRRSWRARDPGGGRDDAKARGARREERRGGAARAEARRRTARARRRETSRRRGRVTGRARGRLSGRVGLCVESRRGQNIKPRRGGDVLLRFSVTIYARRTQLSLFESRSRPLFAMARASSFIMNGRVKKRAAPAPLARPSSHTPPTLVLRSPPERAPPPPFRMTDPRRWHSRRVARAFVVARRVLKTRPPRDPRLTARGSS